MGAIRTCCGYYCAFIMFIGVFFFILTIILELTKNQFMLYHLQEPDFKTEEGQSPIKYVDDNDVEGAKSIAEGKVNNRVISMAIAIGVSVYLVFSYYILDQRCMHFLLYWMCKNRSKEGKP